MTPDQENNLFGLIANVALSASYSGPTELNYDNALRQVNYLFGVIAKQAAKLHRIEDVLGRDRQMHVDFEDYDMFKPMRFTDSLNNIAVSLVSANGKYEVDCIADGKLYSSTSYNQFSAALEAFKSFLEGA